MLVVASVAAFKRWWLKTAWGISSELWKNARTVVTHALRCMTRWVSPNTIFDRLAAASACALTAAVRPTEKRRGRSGTYYSASDHEEIQKIEISLAFFSCFPHSLHTQLLLPCTWKLHILSWSFRRGSTSRGPQGICEDPTRDTKSHRSGFECGIWATQIPSRIPCPCGP